ncbi:hypothetical protein NE237_001357 [Protea cynaroides]|uniref:Uncharacterized protein n=1 Tax=Protea cynaroides TaxID=273540 RepID=A0A9Q0KU04_9MAGN|nr:hypothetical protein NE237_001357 [Protea cynaroides]
MDSGIEPYDVARKHGLLIPRDENDLKLDSNIEPFDASENDCIQNAGCPVSSKGNNGFEHCSGSEDSKVEKLCRELFGNSCSCPKCEGSSQEICANSVCA